MTHAGSSFLVALGLDALLGEPPAAVHPVVWLGKIIDALERRAPRQGTTRQLAYGAWMTAATITAAAGPAAVAGRLLHRLGGLPAILMEGALLKPGFALRALLEAGTSVQNRLQAGDLDGARFELRSLVSRDVSGLDESLMAAAAIESLAENLSDSLIGPLLAHVVGGLPGLWAYRAVNTLDSRIGYHGRYEYLGKTAARLDDLLNLLPSRLTARLLVLSAAICGEDAEGAWKGMRRDASQTESPNAGWPMSAMAGALGVRLEKVGHYHLNPQGAAPRAADINRAARLVRTSAILATALALTLGGRFHAGPASR